LAIDFAPLSAPLNHPNIAAVFAIDQSDGMTIIFASKEGKPEEVIGHARRT
jgi:hypothetical protein